MSDRQRKILDLFVKFGYWGTTACGLGADLNAPEASIRRDILSLRRQGWNISFASPNGVYRLGQ